MLTERLREGVDLDVAAIGEEVNERVAASSGLREGLHDPVGGLDGVIHLLHVVPGHALPLIAEDLNELVQEAGLGTQGLREGANSPAARRGVEVVGRSHGVTWPTNWR